MSIGCIVLHIDVVDDFIPDRGATIDDHLVLVNTCSVRHNPENKVYSHLGRLRKKRLKGAENQAQEGTNICIDMVNELREIEGVAGVHIMAYRQEHRVPEIVEKSGVLAGRHPWHPSVYQETQDCLDPVGRTNQTT